MLHICNHCKRTFDCGAVNQEECGTTFKTRCTPCTQKKLGLNGYKITKGIT